MLASSCSSAGAGAPAAGEAQAEGDVRRHAQRGEDARRLEGAGDAVLGEAVRRRAGEALAEGEQLARGRRHHAGEGVEEGGLAGAVRADDADQLARRERGADRIDRGQAAEADRQRARLDQRMAVHRRAPADRGQPARQIEHREDQQQAERHHVDLRHLQAQRLGQQAEHHRREQRPPERRRAADQGDQHRLEADEGVEDGGRVDVGPAHAHRRADGAGERRGEGEAGDLDEPRVDAEGLGPLLVGADAGHRQAEAALPDEDRGEHRGDREAEHRQVDRVALRHDRQHPSDRAGDLLLEVGDRVADQLGHAEGQDREVGAAQVQHRRAHDHRHGGGDRRAEADRRQPGQRARGSAPRCRRRCRRRPRSRARGSGCCRRKLAQLEASAAYIRQVRASETTKSLATKGSASAAPASTARIGRSRRIIAG